METEEMGTLVTVVLVYTASTRKMVFTTNKVLEHCVTSFY